MTLRPKSDRLTGLDRSQWNYARWPLYSELPYGRLRLRGTFRTWTANLRVHSEGRYCSRPYYTILDSKTQMNRLYTNRLINNLINSIEKRAVTATARSLCLNSLCLKMDRLIAGLLRKLRPKSNKLTGLDRSLFYWRTQGPFVLNYLWPLSAQRNVPHMNSHRPGPIRR